MRKRTTLILTTVVATMLLALVPAAGADEQYEFESVVFDIAATPDGSILAGDFRTIKEIRKGEISVVAEMPTDLEPGDINNAEVAGTINGLSVTGRRSFFATRIAPDLAVEAGVFHFSNGGWRLVGNIEEFEQARDPDAFEGPMWKDQACEFDPDANFSAGPQSNPYHLTARSGSEVIVGDAAGNTVLSVKANGQPVELIALLTPPLDGDDYAVLFPLDEDTDCYVQPVATSVAIGPGGDMLVGELTGATAAGLPIGMSRIWRVDAKATDAVCSEKEPDATETCELFADGFTSIIDLEFGPDGRLYVVEYDDASWLAAFIPGIAAGGTIHACDLDANCEIVASELEFPSAITFDKRGNLWLLENNATQAITGNPPTVRKLDLP
ncbi:MAG TPA: ScyD/ScyE family protein [Acidimicrobiia bacterium]|nr:ScyD/ScyE family protein [Acidimicrobiia bacterium]